MPKAQSVESAFSTRNRRQRKTPEVARAHRPWADLLEVASLRRCLDRVDTLRCVGTSVCGVRCRCKCTASSVHAFALLAGLPLPALLGLPPLLAGLEAFGSSFFWEAWRPEVRVFFSAGSESAASSFLGLRFSGISRLGPRTESDIKDDGPATLLWSFVFLSVISLGFVLARIIFLRGRLLATTSASSLLASAHRSGRQAVRRVLDRLQGIYKSMSVSSSVRLRARGQGQTVAPVAERYGALRAERMSVFTIR